MTPAIHQCAPPPADYVVPGPRSTDAIGGALRGAFDDRCPLPEEMLAALKALDRIGHA